MPEVPIIKNKEDKDEDMEGFIDPYNEDMEGFADPYEPSLRAAPPLTIRERIGDILPEWLGGKSNIDPDRATMSLIDAETLSILTGRPISPSAIYEQKDSIDEILRGKKYDTGEQTARKIFKSLYPAGMIGMYGNIRNLEEIMTPPLAGEIKPELLEGYEGPRPIITDIGKQGAEYWSKKLKEQDIDAAPDSMKRMAYLISTNFMQNVPFLIAAIMTQGKELPLLGLGLLGRGQRYQEGKEAGEGKGTASLMANITFVSEFMSELLPFEQLQKAGIPLAKRLLLSAGFDVPGELLNTSIDAAVDKVTIRPDMNVGDYISALIETAVVSLGTAGLMTITAHPLVWAREQHQKRIDDYKKLKNDALKELIEEKDAEVLKALTGQEAEPAEKLKVSETKDFIEPEKTMEEVKTEIDEVIPDTELIDEITERILEQYPDATDEEIGSLIEQEITRIETSPPDLTPEEITIANDVIKKSFENPNATDEDIGKIYDEMIDKMAGIETKTEEAPIEKPTVKDIPNLIKDINAAFGEEGAIGGKGIDIDRIEEDVFQIGQIVWEEGKTTYKEWSAKIKEYAGVTWEKIKYIADKIYSKIKSFNEVLGERGSIGYEESELKPRDVKKVIESITGVKQSKEIKNLKYAFIKAVKASRKGYKTGVNIGKFLGREEILNPIKTTKQRIAEATGLTKTEELENLKYGYKMSARAAREGAKAATIETREKIKEKIKYERQLQKDKKSLESIKGKYKGKIALSYQDKLDAFFGEIDFKKPTEDTYARLSNLAQFIEEEGVPLHMKTADVLELKRLSQISFKDMSEQAREFLVEKAQQFYKLGKLKRNLELSSEQRRLQKKSEALLENTVNLDPKLSGEKKPTKWDITITYFKKRHMDALHTFRQADIADGSKDYKGENAKMIKEQMKNEIRIKAKNNNAVESLLKEIQALGITEIDEDTQLRITANLMYEQNAKTQMLELMYDYGLAERDPRTGKILADKPPTVNETERKIMDIVRKYASIITSDVIKTYEKRENKRFTKVDKYFPIKYLKEYMISPESEIRHDRHRTKETEQGFTIKRIPDVKKAPRIDFLAVLEENLYAQHWYAYMQPMLDEHSAITNTPEYKEKAGQMMWNWWKDQIDIVARKGWSATAKSNAWLRQTRINMNQAIMGFKATTILVQPFAAVQAISYAQSRWGTAAATDIAVAFSKAWLSPFESAKEAETIEVEKLRKGGELAIEETMEKKGKYDKYVKAGMMGIRYSDLITAHGNRKGFIEILKKHGVENVEEEADFLMNLTQGSTEITIRPHILASGEAARTFLTFQNFALNNYGLIIHDLIQTGFKGNWKRKLNTSLAMLIMLAGGIAEDKVREIIYEFISGKKARTDEDLIKRAMLHFPRQIPVIGGAYEPWQTIEAPLLRAAKKGLSGTGKVLTSIPELEPIDYLKGSMDTIEGILTIQTGLPGTAQMFDIIERLIPEKEREKKPGAYYRGKKYGTK